ncbi:hypothetical protein ACFE04_023946 [Oxalis oulophora]
MEEIVENSLVEERKQLMVSLFDDTTTISRAAYFLKPTLTTSIDHESQLPNPPLLSSTGPRKRPIKLDKSWLYPSKDWKTWVDYLRPKFESKWKEAGIFEAILVSTLRIEKDENLIMGIAEKWCPDTNTIIFPWAEATITLEDVMILGGYSVLGYSIPCSISEPRLYEIKQKLKSAKVEIGKSGNCSLKIWANKFMKSGSEIEHEAFLTYWIARFVFPVSRRVIKDCLFPLAIDLARGKLIALGPAVLASIYKDLRVLKEAIVASTIKFDNGETVLEVNVWSPICLVQMWAFERFPKLLAKPNTINLGDPRAALWNNVKLSEVENIRSILDSARETFRWRPYAAPTINWPFPKFYREKAEWLPVNSNLEEELYSYLFCLRPSDLVGIAYIEQYQPHRVAMQFGMDQDIPGHIVRCNENPEIAWKNYAGSRNETKLYIASCLFESGVTVRYLKWWKQSVSVKKREISRRRRRFRRTSKRAKRIGPVLVYINNKK